MLLRRSFSTVLTRGAINKCVESVRYAVRGELVTRAEQLQNQVCVSEGVAAARSTHARRNARRRRPPLLCAGGTFTAVVQYVCRGIAVASPYAVSRCVDVIRVNFVAFAVLFASPAQ